MSLRNQLMPHTEDKEKDIITFEVHWTESCSSKIECHHEELLSWLKNILNLCQKIAEDAELDKYDKFMLLNYWLDDLGDIKDEWLPHNDDEDDK